MYRSILTMAMSLALALCCAIAKSEPTGISDAHRSALERYLSATGSVNVFRESIVRGLERARRETLPGAHEVSATDLGRLTDVRIKDVLLRVYARYWSEPDAKQIARFFDSHTGRRIQQRARYQKFKQRGEDPDVALVELSADDHTAIQEFQGSDAGQTLATTIPQIAQELRSEATLLLKELVSDATDTEGK